MATTTRVSSAGYRKIYDAICNRATSESEIVNLSQIGHESGYSRRYVYEAVRQMIDRGTIEPQPRGGRYYRFRINNAQTME